MTKREAKAWKRVNAKSGSAAKRPRLESNPVATLTQAMEVDEVSDDQMDALDEDDGQGHIGTPAQIQEQVKQDYLAALTELAKTHPVAQCIKGIKEDRY